MPSPKPNYSAPALEKGIDILELLADQPAGLTQLEIARQLGRSVSEIFRMLNCLVQRGYVMLNKPGDIYTLTLKLFEMAHRHPPMRRLVAEALPHMAELARMTSQSCHITVIHNDHILVVAQVESPASLGFSVRTGAQLDILQTASGMVMLTFQSPEDRARMLLAHDLASGAKSDAAKIESQLAKIRALGYEEADSLQIHGIKNISFPVLDHAGHAYAAITVPFLRRLDEENDVRMAETRDMLKKLSAKLSAQSDTLAA